MKIIRNVFFVLIALAVVLAVGSAVFVHQYEDEIEQYVLREINKELNTELKMSKDIEFSVLQKFPYASLKLKNVQTEEVTDQADKDTLFYFDRIYFQFNVIDILKKQYRIKKIQADRGVLKIKKDKNGKGNFMILKSGDEEGKSPLTLALESVQFTNTRFAFDDAQTNQHIDLKQADIDLRGNFSENQYELSLETEAFLKDLMIRKVHWLQQKQIELDLDIAINENQNRYDIKSGTLLLDGMELSVKGNIKARAETTELDLQLSGKNLDLMAVKAFLPPDLMDKIKNYNLRGKGWVNTAVKGEIGKNASPAISGTFGINNAELEIPARQIVLNDLTLEGKYANGSNHNLESSSLSLEYLTARLGKGKVTGKLALNNLKQPVVNLSTETELEVAELARILQIDTVENIAGLMKLNATFSGQLNDLENINKKELMSAHTSGSINIMDVNFKLKKNNKTFSGLQGDFIFEDNDLQIKNFSGLIAGTDFELEGYFRNFLSFTLLPGQHLTVDARLKSKLVDLDQLLESEQSGNNDEEYYFSLPEHITCELWTKIDHLKFRKFSARNIEGKIILNDHVLTADALNFQALGGKVLARLKLDEAPGDQTAVECLADFKGIDVSRLFEECENFGQEFIQNQHLKGKADVALNLTSSLNPQLEFDFDALNVSSDITIREGEFIDFEPLMALSRFASIDELRHVQFSTLTNHIDIHDRKVFIPKMNIHSNALDLDLSGVHSFDNEIDYHFRVLLSDIVGNEYKRQRLLEKDEEFEWVKEDEDGKTNLYIGMKGTTDDFKFYYDTKAVKQKIKKDLKEEKKDIKLVLNKEFGWFKGDSAVINHQKEKPTGSDIKISWDEMENEVEEPEDKRKKLKPIKPKKEGTKQDGGIKVEFD